MKRKELTALDDIGANPAFNNQLDSDFGIIASHIFGTESLKTIFDVGSWVQEVTEKLIIQNTNVWIHKVLDGIEPAVSTGEEDHRPGRLGRAQVRFDSTAQVGTLTMSADRLHAQAQSNFSTVKANVCLYSGKWQYELQLESKGVMQLGWAMADGEFTPETGVGDTLYSYSYDGNRVRKWNLVTLEYGEAWQVGDVIGCTLDLDIGSIHFYRNGRDLGEAFSSIPLGPGCVYYPAISLAYEEKVQANFGSLPLKYPVDTYQPVQQAPTGVVLRANQLLHWLFRTSSVPKTILLRKNKTVELTRRKQSSDAAVMIFCELLVGHLKDLLSSLYVVEACVLPFLHDVTSVSVDRKTLPVKRSLDKLNFLCDSLMLYLEPDDSKELVNTICKCLLQKYDQTALSLDYVKQRQSLAMMADIVQNTKIRQTFLRQPTFIKMRLPEFMDLKVIDIVALKQAVPQPWWNVDQPPTGKRDKEYEAKKRSYLENCQTIKTKTSELEALQESLLVLFLNNTDGSDQQPTSRKCFLRMFRLFLKDNHITGLVSFFLNNQSADQTPLPIAFSFFQRLISILRLMWEKECGSDPAVVPLSVFYGGEVDYFTIDRLGGVLSHLIHTFRTPLATQLGEDHRVLVEPQVSPALQPTVQVQVRGIDTNTGVVSTMTRWINLGNPLQSGTALVESVSPEAVSNVASLTELLDGLVLLYNIAVHKQLHKISILRDDMDKYITTLNEAKLRLTSAKATCPEAAVEIQVSIQAFERKIEEQSRVLMSWVRGAVYTPEKRANLVWLLRAVLLTLELASQQGDLFAFVPDFYVDTMVDICSAVRNFFSPTLPTDELVGYKTLMEQVAEFLVTHFADPRIVNLSSKDTIIEGLAGFIAKKQTLESLENISPQSQERFVRHLLKPYDNRPWGQSNWILMRMWQGCGFAFRYQKSPHLSRKLGPRTPGADSGLLIHQAFDPCPSPHYQQLVARLLSEDHEMAAEFLNSVLKQLNWSFSEFISMIQEIQNLSKRPERVIIDARQLKICSTFFDFVLGLLRVLEMVCTVCLPVFTDVNQEGTENLLERLCQLLSQILLRVTTPTGCFAHVISLEVPDLDAIDQFPVLTAVVGVLVALLADDMSDKEKPMMSFAARKLLTEPAFQIESLKYMLGERKPASDKQEQFSLKNYPDAVSAPELETASRLISVLSRYQARMSAVKEESEEEDLCPICCAMPLSVTFMPCHHRSCKSCITHHLMDCKECFFCKTAIKSVVGLDGRSLFDSTLSAHRSPDSQGPP